MENEKLFVITVYTENQVGLLSSIAGSFMRRSLNIETLRVYPSGIPGVHKFTIKTRTTEDKMQTLIPHLEKKVDVIRAFWSIDPERSEYELDLVEGYLNERENNK